MAPLPGSWSGSRLTALVATLLIPAVAVVVAACSVSPVGAQTASASTLPACLVSHDGQRTALRVEVASTPDQRQRGLMDRQALGENTGMLFTYDQVQPPSHAFWMFHTRIPLDIAYLDPSDRIAAIVAMEPCRSESASRCPSYPAGVSFLSALEVNQGYFQAHNIAVGDRLELGPDAHCGMAGPSAGQDAD